MGTSFATYMRVFGGITFMIGIAGAPPGCQRRHRGAIEPEPATWLAWVRAAARAGCRHAHRHRRCSDAAIWIGGSVKVPSWLAVTERFPSGAALKKSAVTAPFIFRMEVDCPSGF